MHDRALKDGTTTNQRGQGGELGQQSSHVTEAGGGRTLEAQRGIC